MDPEQSSPEHAGANPDNPNPMAPHLPVQPGATPPDPASGATPNPAYPYPPYAPYPPYGPYTPAAGYPPAGAPTQPAGGYAPPQVSAQPSGAYPMAQPGAPAPNSTAPGAPNAPYPPYPSYPPSPANPSAPYPYYPPYGAPAFPSYPLYSPYASAPYGVPAPGTYPAAPQPPQTPPPAAPGPRRRNPLLLAILGGVTALVIIAVVAVGLLALRGHTGGPTANGTPTATVAPTATLLPTVTPFPGSTVFSDAVPGACGDHSYQWATDNQGARVVCANGVMTLTHPTTEKYIATEFFVPPNYNFPSKYQVSVKIGQVTDGCGGVFVLGASNNGDGYAAYVCADGTYKLVRYDSSGSPLEVDENSTTPGVPHTLTVAVTPTTLDVSVDGQSFSSQPPNYTLTSYLALEADDISQTTNGSASFSNFVFTA